MNKIPELFSDKKILILGFGREGQSTEKFLKKYLPNKSIDVADQKLSSDYLDHLEEYDVIFKSPGIPSSLPEIQNATRKGVHFSSQTKLFFDLCRGMIIGVTGTKGKSTTTSLICHILRHAGKNAVLLGNIGKPCLDYLGDDLGEGKIYCFELSSYQLSDLNRSPHIAVFLNIFQEHLDYHKSQKNYFEAKVNITKYQNSSDFFVYNEAQAELEILAKKCKAKLVPFSNFEIPKKINTALKGEHNLNNIKAAYLAVKCLRVDEDVILQAISSFEPLEHRLELVGEYKGISFYDDALSTIPEATIAALNTFDAKVGTLILGGSDRGQDFSNLAREILSKKVEALILFPTTGERIWSEVKKIADKSLPRHIFVNSMEEAVKSAYELTAHGRICLLSTASPSFTIFKDYEDKAEQFKKYVRKYETNLSL